MKFVLLWSDALIFLLIAAVCVFFWKLRSDPSIRARWAQVFQAKLGMVTFTLIALYLSVALLDSIHFRKALEPVEGQDSTQVFYDNNVRSVLDELLSPTGDLFERTYSAPFATKSFEKQNMKSPEGYDIRDYPALTYGGDHLEQGQSKTADILLKSGIGLFIGLIISALVVAPQWLLLRKSDLPWQACWLTQAGFICFCAWALTLSRYYHILGTDIAGANVFYQSVKGVRTAVLLGTLSTLIMLPIAISLGVMAGYFKGWVDDVVQYLYTTLSSIPGILLIAASVLLFQVFIDLHPDYFEVALEKADAKFVALCFILGVTSWSSLCRLVRAETLKISQLEYVQAAHAFGTSHLRILTRHIMPNLVHIILIAFVLDFSSMVLAEAVLSYIGVGIDPSMGSWGNMINSARYELSREPAIWWTLSGAFLFMFILVLAANLFSDLVRDAFDPRTAIGEDNK